MCFHKCLSGFTLQSWGFQKGIYMCGYIYLFIYIYWKFIDCFLFNTPNKWIAIFRFCTKLSCLNIIYRSIHCDIMWQNYKILLSNFRHLEKNPVQNFLQCFIFISILFWSIQKNGRLHILHTMLNFSHSNYDMDRLFFITLNMIICYRLIFSDKCKNVRLLKKLLQV